VAAVRRGRPKPAVLHLLAPQSVPVDRVLDPVARLAGLPTVPYPKFWAALRDHVVAGGGDELTRLLSVLPDPTGESDVDGKLAGLFTDGAQRFGAARSGQLLDDLGLRWPPVDDALLRRYAERAVAVAGRPA